MGEIGKMLKAQIEFAENKPYLKAALPAILTPQQTSQVYYYVLEHHCSFEVALEDLGFRERRK